MFVMIMDGEALLKPQCTAEVNTVDYWNVESLAEDNHVSGKSHQDLETLPTCSVLKLESVSRMK